MANTVLIKMFEAKKFEKSFSHYIIVPCFLLSLPSLRRTPDIPLYSCNSVVFLTFRRIPLIPL